MTTILLLGGFGFIGTNILKYVESSKNLSDRYQFIVFDRNQEHPRRIRFKTIKKIYSGEFTDEFYLDKIFAENKIDIVIHSLSSTVPATSSNARFDVESNLLPTLNLLDAMRKYKVKDIIYISSGGAIYGDVLKKVHNEEDAVYPKSSYGVVKLAIEKYLLSYSELYGFNTMILRLSNPFGKYHYNDKQGVINVAIRCAIRQQTFKIWGEGDGIKDYIFIEDFCSILFLLIENGIDSTVYNVGGGIHLSVNDICEYVKQIHPGFEYDHLPASFLDVQNFELDITKLRNKLGKIPSIKFEQALYETYCWEKSVKSD